MRIADILAAVKKTALYCAMAGFLAAPILSAGQTYSNYSTKGLVSVATKGDVAARGQSFEPLRVNDRFGAAHAMNYGNGEEKASGGSWPLVPSRHRPVRSTQSSQQG